MCSALVTDDTVYFADLGGWFYALDRATGAERWKISARDASFPGAHQLNMFFASPILANGVLIAAGGTLEQVVAASPFYRGSNGRGFVLALEPKTGRIMWKYDLGPKPEKLDPPITITDSFGPHKFYFGPGTSSIWSTPSFDAQSGTIFFGTDVNTAPRRPTSDDPKMWTVESCAVVALDVKDGSKRWVTQINPGDIWTNAMRSYDPKEQRYKDQAIGDTPKLYTITVAGAPVKVVGVGCKNGGFYVLRAADGEMVDHTPIYTGPPGYPLSPTPDPRMLALPSCIGGLQTGCATDGQTIFTNGIDALKLGSQEKAMESGVPPTGGRVVALESRHQDRALAARAAEAGHDRRAAAEGRLQRCRRPGGLGYCRCKRSGLFHGRRQRKTGCRQCQHRQPVERNRDRPGVVRALGLARAGCIQAQGIRCSGRGIMSRFSPRIIPACSTRLVCRATMK